MGMQQVYPQVFFTAFCSVQYPNQQRRSLNARMQWRFTQCLMYFWSIPITDTTYWKIRNRGMALKDNILA